MNMQAHTHFKRTTNTWWEQTIFLENVIKVLDKGGGELTVTRAESHVAWIQGFIKATEYRL